MKNRKKPYRFQIYTDGSKTKAENVPPISGCAFLVYDRKKNIIIEKQFFRLSGEVHSTEAELEGLLQALTWANKQAKHKKFEIISDSETIVNCLKGVYKRRKNRGYWNQIEPLCDSLVGRFAIKHINSHQKSNELEVKLNNKVDRLAKIGANNLQLEIIEKR